MGCTSSKDAPYAAIGMQRLTSDYYTSFMPTASRRDKLLFKEHAKRGQSENSLFFTKFLPQKGDKIIAEYVWIDGSGAMRAKCRTLPRPVRSLSDLPDWNYDGSSCYQATTENSEVIMKPVAFFPDPFRGGNNIIVLTECFTWADKNFEKLVPANTNFRSFVRPIFKATQDE